MLKNIVKIQYNSDFTLNCKLPNGYDNQDFIIRLYTTDKDNYYEASYLNGEYENCLTDSENKNIVVYVNNHNLQPGCLHIGMQFDYDNTHFADNVENIITAEETNVYLVKQNANATSAMYVGSALPDLTGSTDFVTQSDLEFELLNYYTKEDIDNASYISSSDLNDYVTEEELNDMEFLSQAQLDAMGYATVSYVDTKTNQKQDRLINGVNIKTVNGYSLLGNGNISISGISQDDLDNAIAPLVSQEALTETLSSYITESELNNMSYVTTTDLNNASYVSHAELNSASYATQSFVDDAVADAITEIDVPTYTSDLTNDSGFITASALNGYATESYVSDYVAQHAPTPDLSAYVTKTELNNASYVTTSDLNNAISGIDVPTYTSDLTNDSGFITSIPAEYVTQNELSSMSYATTSQLPNMNNYVSKTELSNASYATTTQVNDKQDALVSGTNIKTVNNESLLGSGNITITGGSSISEVTQAQYDAMEQAGTLDSNTIYVITDAAPTDLSYYVLQSDLENMGYATETYVSDYVAQHAPIPDLSAYVKKTELSGMGYITMSDVSACGYITAVPAEYVTETELDNMSYASTTYVADYVSAYSGGGGGAEDYSKVLTFTAQDANSTIKFNITGTLNLNIQYSLDNCKTWNDYTWSSNTGETITLANVGDTVKFKGINNAISTSNSNYLQAVMTGKFRASGDITSLLNGYGGNVSLYNRNYCFYFIFANCSSLITPPNLPSTTLAQYCYAYMFWHCTSLITPPELPATTMYQDCYQDMFDGCTKLQTIPNLPATTLASECYQNMFIGCTSLKSIVLPEATMAHNCYRYMFKNCTSLESATISATAAGRDIINRASGCVDIFMGCTNLKYVKTMIKDAPTTILYDEWLYNTYSTGTLVFNNEITWDPETYRGAYFPTNWNYYKTNDLVTNILPEAYVEDNGKTIQVVNGVWTKVVGGGGGGSTQEQADWNETDSSYVSYILNKPDLSNYLTSSNFIYDSSTYTLTISI